MFAPIHKKNFSTQLEAIRIFNGASRHSLNIHVGNCYAHSQS